MNGMETIKATVYLDEELTDWIIKLAEDAHRSFSAQVCVMLGEWFDEHPEKVPA
jgi:hypothetical protein